MKKYVWCFAISMLFINACKKSTIALPVTCASISADSIGAGQFITFSSCTKGATSTLWNFGDSSTSNSDTISHTYYIPGTYTVTLTTSNSSGKGLTKTFTIVVSAPDYWTFKGIKYYSSNLSTYILMLITPLVIMQYYLALPVIHYISAIQQIYQFHLPGICLLLFHILIQ